MIDLNNEYHRKKVLLQIYNDVDKFCREEFADDPRKHLGASIIGHDCMAYGWNTFRWLRFEDFSGQMLRLFNRGHEEERRFVRWLVGIGFEVREVDPVTSKQYRIVGSKGHFGGSLDSLIAPPARYEIPAEFMVWLGEFKTHNEKSFAKLAGPKPQWREMGRAQSRTGGQGVILAKPQHYKQMCSYGKAYGYRFGLYCAVNKDTDELYFEIVPLDWRLADDLYRKADAIIFSQKQPQKIAQTEAFFDCKVCDFKGICHRGEAPTKNCRSCLNAVPVDDAQWRCEFHQAIIPDEVIPQGCDNWRRII